MITRNAKREEESVNVRETGGRSKRGGSGCDDRIHLPGCQYCSGSHAAWGGGDIPDPGGSGYESNDDPSCCADFFRQV